MSHKNYAIGQTKTKGTGSLRATKWHQEQCNRVKLLEKINMHSQHEWTITKYCSIQQGLAWYLASQMYGAMIGSFVHHLIPWSTLRMSGWGYLQPYLKVNPKVIYVVSDHLIPSYRSETYTTYHNMVNPSTPSNPSDPIRMISLMAAVQQPFTVSEIWLQTPTLADCLQMVLAHKIHRKNQKFTL